MNPSALEILLQEGEGTLLEYKESLSASFARELVALANTLGGRILLGVRDDGKVAGIGDSNELRARIQDIARNCDPPVKVLLERVGKVTVVTVRESDAKPVQCSDGFFWRQGAVTQKLSRAEIRDFFRREGGVRFDLPSAPRSATLGTSTGRSSKPGSTDGGAPARPVPDRPAGPAARPGRRDAALGEPGRGGDAGDAAAARRRAGHSGRAAGRPAGPRAVRPAGHARAPGLTPCVPRSAPVCGPGRCAGCRAASPGPSGPRRRRTRRRTGGR